MSKKAWTYIFGALLILFGIVFLVSPQGTFASIVLVAGIILIVYAAIGIISAIVSQNPLASYTIGGSVLGLIFGIILVTNTEAAVKVVPIVLGIWLFISGLSSLIFTTKVTKETKALVGPITRIILGVIAFALPVIPVVGAGIFLGIVLILSGISTITNEKNDEVIYKVKVKK